MIDKPTPISIAVEMSDEKRKSITPGLVKKINAQIKISAENGDYSASYFRDGISDSDERLIKDIYTEAGYIVSFDSMSFITFIWKQPEVIFYP